MGLSSFEPDPAWDPAANAGTVAVFSSVPSSTTITVWGGDWCGDCRRELPALAAALKAADLPDDAVTVYEVTKEITGPHVEAYKITVLPTVIVEMSGEVVARFEEAAPVPAAVALAEAMAPHVD